MFLQVQHQCFHCCYSWVCSLSYLTFTNYRKSKTFPCNRNDVQNVTDRNPYFCVPWYVVLVRWRYLMVLWWGGADPYVNTIWMQHLKMAVLVMQVDLNIDRPCSKVWYCYFSILQSACVQWKFTRQKQVNSHNVS